MGVPGMGIGAGVNGPPGSLPPPPPPELGGGAGAKVKPADEPPEELDVPLLVDAVPPELGAGEGELVAPGLSLPGGRLTTFVEPPPLVPAEPDAPVSTGKRCPDEPDVPLAEALPELEPVEDLPLVEPLPPPPE